MLQGDFRGCCNGQRGSTSAILDCVVTAGLAEDSTCGKRPEEQADGHQKQELEALHTRIIK